MSVDLNDREVLDLVARLGRTALIGARGDTVDAMALLSTAMHVVATNRHTRADAAELLRAVADSLINTARLVESGAARRTTETV
jgi:D-arabinose 1-dehydrogenase-like Zn-dependent alcohol dehydrogenase